MHLKLTKHLATQRNFILKANPSKYHMQEFGRSLKFHSKMSENLS